MLRYILVPSTGEKTDGNVFSTAIAVARLWSSHLTFLHVQADPRLILTAMTSATDLSVGIDYPGVVDALERASVERRERAELAFREFCQQEHLAVPGEPSLISPSAEWKSEIGDEAACVAECGRVADLIVIGRVHDGSIGDLGVLEAALMTTGRPVLIPAAAASSRLTGTVVIAWKNRPEAARAVAAARPFIARAERVIILSVEEGTELDEQSCQSLENALTWHNPKVCLQRLKQDGRPAVETLLAAASAAKADLLVMGGYGHSRLREVVFGGFTRRVLNSADLPVLMVH